MLSGAGRVVDVRSSCEGEHDHLSGSRHANVTHDAQLQELLDERQIRAVIYRYCRGIDRCQYEDVRSCYHPEATDHHGDFYGTVDEFVAHVAAVLPTFESTMHFVGNLAIEVKGDTARSEAYTLALARLSASDDQPARDNIVALRYVDDFERRGDEWRIIRRVCAYEWTRTDPVASGWSLPENFLRGRRDANDVVFTATLPAPAQIPVPVPRQI
jgi:ketosteroid isomerase-like protein